MIDCIPGEWPKGRIYEVDFYSHNYNKTPSYSKIVVSVDAAEAVIRARICLSEEYINFNTNNQWNKVTSTFVCRLEDIDR